MEQSVKIKVLSFAVVGVLVALMVLYTKELAVFFNTIELRTLLIGSELVMGLLLAGVLFQFKDRFQPLNRHLPEIVSISVAGLLFAPLLGSLFNRIPGQSQYESFSFISEQAYLASGYGYMRAQTNKPTGWMLQVSDKKGTYRFKYKKQPYFPITKPGEQVQLPVRQGLFGVRVVELK